MQAVQFGRQSSLSSGSLSCGNSFPAIEQAMATPTAEEERLVDTQTWIVQASLMLQVVCRLSAMNLDPIQLYSLRCRLY